MNIDKTLGQVAFEGYERFTNWDHSPCQKNWHNVAQAVVEEVVKRMEAVPFSEIWDAWTSEIYFKAGLLAVRNRLVAAARGQINLEDAVGATPGSFAKVCDDPKTGELPAPEIPWIEWHGGECPLRDEDVEEWEHKHVTCSIFEKCKPSEIMWKHNGTVSDIIAYRVTKWREGCGPKAADWKAIVKASIEQLNMEGTTPENLAMQINKKIMQRDEIHMKTIARAEKAEAELARIVEAAHEAGWNGVENSKDLAQFIKNQDQDLRNAIVECNHAINAERAAVRNSRLSRLRPIAEAGPVPEGAVRIYTEYYDHTLLDCETERWRNTTHYADILLPEASQPLPIATLAQDQIQTTPETEAPKYVGYMTDEMPAAEAADPYAELKAAHAAGKVIQSRGRQYAIGARPWSEWTDEPAPDWSLSNDVEYRIKPEPETFEAHGKTWTKFNGDGLPCDGQAMVEWLLDDELNGRMPFKSLINKAKNLGSWCNIVGWRYADEQPTPEIIIPPPWTPKVGDVVTLRSGGPKMTISNVEDEAYPSAVWFTDGHIQTHKFDAETLQPA